jgi:hypothetical protein
MRSTPIWLDPIGGRSKDTTLAATKDDDHNLLENGRKTALADFTNAGME